MRYTPDKLIAIWLENGGDDTSLSRCEILPGPRECLMHLDGLRFHPDFLQRFAAWAVEKLPNSETLAKNIVKLLWFLNRSLFHVDYNKAFGIEYRLRFYEIAGISLANISLLPDLYLPEIRGEEPLVVPIDDDDDIFMTVRLFVDGRAKVDMEMGGYLVSFTFSGFDYEEVSPDDPMTSLDK